MNDYCIVYLKQIVNKWHKMSFEARFFFFNRLEYRIWKTLLWCAWSGNVTNNICRKFSISTSFLYKICNMKPKTLNIIKNIIHCLSRLNKGLSSTIVNRLPEKWKLNEIWSFTGKYHKIKFFALTLHFIECFLF